MTNKELREEYKLLAEFCGYVYIPLEYPKQPYIGWYWKDPRKIFEDRPHPKIAAHFYICRNSKDLLFKYDFNRIMRVVDKIEEIGTNKWGKITVTIEGDTCKISIPEGARESYSFTTIGETKLKAVYEACLNFIKWYNQNA